jgi:hypothetical protein
MVQFRWANAEDKKLFDQLREVLVDLRGPIYSMEPNSMGILVRRVNSFWRFEVVRAYKKRRIYLRNESDLTMAMLMIKK